MEFRITTMLWAFALLASALATFGGVGIVAVCLIFWLLWLRLRRPRTSFSEWLAVVIILSVLAALLLPATSHVRYGIARLTCTNNMKQLSLGLHNYVSVHNTLPASAQSNPNSDHLQSWRIWIAPYLESSQFYAQFKRNESWDSPANKKTLLNYNFDPLFNCPSHITPSNVTHYFAIVGEQTMWPPGRGRKLNEITDGTADTIMLIEASHKAVPWAKPEDLSSDEAVELLTNPPMTDNFGYEVDEGFFYRSTRGINVAFADGYVQFLGLPISHKHAVALLTVDGGEDLELEDVRRLTTSELDYGRIYGLSVFLLLSLAPIVKLRRKKGDPLE